MNQALLSVENLSITTVSADRRLDLIRGLDLQLCEGEIVGLVGESGVGKSLTALAIIGLLPTGVEIESGRILFAGEDLRSLNERARRRFRGRRIAMVFQDPLAALNPVLTIGYQVLEAVRAAGQLDRASADKQAATLLERVALARAASRLGDYPHELSGGERQRVAIAMALAAKPDLLLADEPTSALDPTLQLQILDLLEDLNRDLGLTMLLISHDLAVIAEICQRVAVMSQGEIVEYAEVTDLFSHPEQVYTRTLLEAMPVGVGSHRSDHGRYPEAHPSGSTTEQEGV